MEEDELYEVLDLETDERFRELDAMVEDVIRGVSEGGLSVTEGYSIFNDKCKEIFPVIAKDPVIGKKFLVDRAHTIMLLAILKKLGRMKG
jgi:hypothetical protein